MSGITVGAVLGTGAAIITKGVAAIEISEERKFLNKIPKAASRILGKTPLLKFAAIGGVIGMLMNIYDTIKYKNIKEEAEKLKLMS